MRFVFAILFSVLLPTAFAAPGELDPSFGNGGIVTATIELPNGLSYGGWGYGVTVQPDGRILLAGTYSGTGAFAVLRFHPDGSSDTSFNGTGKVATGVGGWGACTSIALQDDRKIIVAGQVDTNGVRSFAVVRYLHDGSLDPSFGGGTGKVITAVGSSVHGYGKLAVQRDGKILLSGAAKVGSNFDFALLRYHTDGSLDPTFGGTGIVTTAVGNGDDYGYGMVLQHDGKILVAGRSGNSGNNDFGLVRYQTDGSLDTNLGGTGKATITFGTNSEVCYGVAVQRDGKIVLAGQTYNGSYNSFALARCHADGSLDPSFGGGTGKVITTFGIDATVQGMALQYDGKIVVAGVAGTTASPSREDFALARYQPDGSLDTSFGGTGKFITRLSYQYDLGLCVALQGDGKMLVAGASDGLFAVARYESGIMPPYAQWKLTNLGDANAPDTGNGDADSFVNLVEYALVLRPGDHDAAQAGGRFAYADGERLRMVFTRDPARDDVTIEAEVAGAMEGPWTTVASSVLGAPFTGAGYVGGHSAGAGLKTVEVRDVVNLGDPAHPRRYLRLRVKR